MDGANFSSGAGLYIGNFLRHESRRNGAANHGHSGIYPCSGPVIACIIQDFWMVTNTQRQRESPVLSAIKLVFGLPFGRDRAPGTTCFRRWSTLTMDLNAIAALGKLPQKWR